MAEQAAIIPLYRSVMCGARGKTLARKFEWQENPWEFEIVPKQVSEVMEVSKCTYRTCAST